MSRPRRRASIALPIFALTIVSVVLTAVLLFVVTFRGPPPRPAPVRLEVVASALRDRIAPPLSDQPMRLVEDAAPSPLPGHAQPVTTAQTILAQMLRVPRDQVRVYAFEAQREPFMLRGPFSAAVRNGSGWRVLSTQPPRTLSKWHVWTLQAMLMACVVLGIAAWLIARAITRPLAVLADAAAHGRVGRDIVVPPGGPRELHALGEALSGMHGRLARHAQSRMAMLAAIAHDLGTPLSRLAFWVEQLPDDARTRAAADIDEMRAMLGEVLRFARDERIATNATVDLGSVLDSLVDDLAVAGRPVTLTPGERVLVKGDPAALRRLFANLIDNAIRYGEAARVAWAIDGDRVSVTVDDDGRGVDAEAAEALFQPFVRGDPSRNRATGGTGLGLAIVRSLAEAHGGDVALGRGAHGGGRATVKLPRA
ncbi:sensor histidine kinase [Sphingomonas sp. RS2018]